jgi:hypothetical protein
LLGALQFTTIPTSNPHNTLTRNIHGLQKLCRMQPRSEKPNKNTHQRPVYFILVWFVPLAQVWTHYKVGKLNVWT